jgi:hypothetical protein
MSHRYPPAALVVVLKVGRMPNNPASVSGRPMSGFAHIDEAEPTAIAEHLTRKNLR